VGIFDSDGIASQRSCDHGTIFLGQDTQRQADDHPQAESFHISKKQHLGQFSNADVGKLLLKRYLITFE
jgi:hypothetical protein